MIRCLAILACVAALFASAITTTQARDLPFADPAFQRVWDASDQAVASGAVSRSWLWGPAPFADSMAYYKDAPGSFRLVQFFDKSRMEINDPNADPNSTWYVTNGLLVKEMVSGQVQYGDAAFTPQPAATIPVAGDVDDSSSPTYASFGAVATLSGTTNEAVDRTGQTITDAIDKAGVVSQIAPQVNTHVAYYETATHHNIADVFWNWMNDPANGIQTYGSYVYPMGYPITDPYWVTAKVGGVQRNVLVQLFERRVLTYTPDNPAGWQVEMGNVGRAYVKWVYQVAFDVQPTWSPDGQQLLFTSNRDGNRDLFSIQADGTNLRQLTTTPGNEQNPLWEPDSSHIYYESVPGGIYESRPDGSSVQNWQYAQTSWSPDGSRFTYAGVLSGNALMSVRSASGDSNHQVISLPGGMIESSIWSPDGSKIAFEFLSNDFQHVGASLYVVNVDGSNAIKLTSDFPGGFGRLHYSWSPDSSRIAYAVDANGAGTQSINVINADGSDSLPILSLSGQYGYSHYLSWSPDGSRIYFMNAANDQPGALWAVSPDGSSPAQLAPSVAINVTGFALSPTGDRIAFTRWGSANHVDLWVMNSDGSNARLLDSPPGW